MGVLFKKTSKTQNRESLTHLQKVTWLATNDMGLLIKKSGRLIRLEKKRSKAVVEDNKGEIYYVDFKKLMGIDDKTV